MWREAWRQFPHEESVHAEFVMSAALLAQPSCQLAPIPTLPAVPQADYRDRAGTDHTRVQGYISDLPPHCVGSAWSKKGKREVRVPAGPQPCLEGQQRRPGLIFVPHV